MTKKLTIELPDDLEQQLTSQSESSSGNRDRPFPLTPHSRH